MNKKIVIAAVAIVGIVAFVVLVSKDRTAKVENHAATPATNTKEAKELYVQANKLRQMNEPLRAQAAYQEILKNHPDIDNMAMVQQEAEALNMQILFSRMEVPGKTVMHEVVPGDSLAKIAKKYGTTVELIRKSNNMNSDVIRLGEKIRVWIGKFNVFVDKSQNILILKEGNDIVKVYTVSTGENNSTPVGTFKIVTKLENPVWFNKGIVVPPESPQNVLGTRWMGFDIPGYGIHGTVEPKAIGQQVTAGCVRMMNDQVEELYSILPVATEVVIVD